MSTLGWRLVDGEVEESVIAKPTGEQEEADILILIVGLRSNVLNVGEISDFND